MNKNAIKQVRAEERKGKKKEGKGGKGGDKPKADGSSDVKGGSSFSVVLRNKS